MAGPNGATEVTPSNEARNGWSFRLLLICFAAASVGLPIAWISLAKVLVILVGLGYLVANLVRGRTDSVLAGSLTAKAILAVMLVFFASLAWTQIGLDIAFLALVKHAKILVILMLVGIVHTQREARWGIAAFAAGQVFVLASSWLLALGVPIPWTTDPTGDYVVFSTYLDQSIMLATTAAVLWHLRTEKLWPSWLGGVLAIAALADAVLLLDGRTGYAVAITMLTLAVVWAMPRRTALLTLIVTPLLILGSLYFGSSHIQSRVSQVFRESKSFSHQVETKSSAGWRLNAWQRSIEGIEESPWYGHGVGSWALTVKRLQGDTAVQTFGQGNASNPHQEYLLWGVELGIGGSLLFAAMMLSMALDARRFTRPVRQAIWSVLAAMAVACLFNSALYDDLIGDFFCVALGILLSMGFRATPPQRIEAAA